MALKYLPQFKTTKLNVGGGIDNSQTTGIVLLSVDGVDITKPGIVCLSWADPLNTATAEWVSYTSIDGSNELQGVVRGAEGSTGVAHANGVDVAFPVSKSHINDLNDAMLAEHTSAGVHSGLSTTAFSAFNAPEGFLINGKIVPSVASNNLTVAIKGMDGNDPSSTNPVYVRIDNTVRSITSALSVTTNAGQNHLNLGSAVWATKEADLFVHLGWNNAGNNIMLFYSRLPYPTTLGEFSATSTSDKGYYATGTGSGVATDPVVNIGRFAATLSAGAGYTWSVPTFTATNLIQRPIYETRVLNPVPSFTPNTGTFTTTIQKSFFVISGKTCHWRIQTGTDTVGGSPNYLTIPLPMECVAQYTVPVDIIGVNSNTGTTAYPLYWYYSATTAFRAWMQSSTAFINGGYTGISFRWEII